MTETRNPTLPVSVQVSWLLLLLTDSSLPIGGFNHSNGLEAHLKTPFNTLNGFILNSLQSFITFYWSFIYDFYNSLILYKGINNMEECLKNLNLINSDLNAALILNRVSYNASIQIGSGYLNLINHMSLDNELITCFKNENQDTLHYIPCFILMYYSLGFESDSVSNILYILLYLHVKSIISSAIRLNIIGPFEGFRMSIDIQEMVDALIETTLLKPREKGGTCSNPIMEIINGSHSRLYSRLFSS